MSAPGADAKTPPPAPPRGPKRPYRPPRLVVFGRLRDLTRRVGGTVLANDTAKFQNKTG